MFVYIYVFMYAFTYPLCMSRMERYEPSYPPSYGLNSTTTVSSWRMALALNNLQRLICH